MSYTIVSEKESLVVLEKMSINEVNFLSLFNLVGLMILGLR